MIEDPQYLFINTAMREDKDETAYDFTIPIAPEIACDHDQRLQLTITSFCITRTWYWVNETNNIFTIDNNTEIDIPPGNYTFRRLAACVNALLQYHSFPDIKVHYDPNLNKFYFIAPINTLIGFPSLNVFGFSPGTLHVFASSTIPFYSDYPLSIDTCSELRLNVLNVTSKPSYNYENNIQSELRPTNCLFRCSASIAPNATHDYVAQELLWSVEVDEKSISKLRFVVTDERGNVCSFINDFCFTLRIDRLSPIEMEEGNIQISLLKELVDYQRLHFVGKNIGLLK